MDKFKPSYLSLERSVIVLGNSVFPPLHHCYLRPDHCFHCLLYDRPVHCGMYSDILALYPLDASSTPPPPPTRTKTVSPINGKCPLGNTIAPS